MLPTTPEWRTHDYIWHATTSLIAALEIATGGVVKCDSSPPNRAERGLDGIEL